MVLIPAYLVLFVMGRDPNGDGEWGWCLGAVISGFGAGIFYGVLLGGGVGLVIGAIGRGVQRLGDRVGGSEPGIGSDEHEPVT
jgi:hypothetical protein